MEKQESVKGGESEVDSVRLKVDEWLAGVEATREGVFDIFFIQGQGAEGTDIQVTPENADKIESLIRTRFAGRYPDLAPQTPETATQ